MEYIRLTPLGKVKVPIVTSTLRSKYLYSPSLYNVPLFPNQWFGNKMGQYLNLGRKLGKHEVEALLQSLKNTAYSNIVKNMFKNILLTIHQLNLFHHKYYRF